MNELKKFYLTQQFHPGIWGVFLNPFYIIRKDLRKTLLQFIPQLSGNMLDYGCGRKPYKNLFSVTTYTGADIENEGHSHQQEEIEILFDGKKLPVSDNSFDSAFSSEVFEHVFDPNETLQEIHRVLKPGALFLLSVPFVWNEHEVPNDYARYSSFGFPYLLQKNGFEIIELKKSGNFMRVIAQLRALYWYERMASLNPVWRMIVSIFIISPCLIGGLILSNLLPKDQSLYFNLVVLARKPI